MFVLLSEQNKKDLLRQYRLRITSTVAFLASTIFLISIALLLPSYFLLNAEKVRLEGETENFSKHISKKNSEGLINTLNDIKSMVALVVPEETKIFSTIKTILARRPSSVLINSFRYTRGDGKESSLVLEGMAASRNSLISFSKNLKTDPLFKSVDLPISNLARESDVKFTMTIIGKF